MRTPAEGMRRHLDQNPRPFGTRLPLASERVIQDWNTMSLPVLPSQLQSRLEPYSRLSTRYRKLS
jgi:hypothetical protein